jgi:hypothetical protein
MTIKQQGGIFGRNPTFNTITSDGNASIGGDIVLQGGNKVYFDGGVDNYMDMFSADKIRIAVGGAASFKLENPPHNAFILNSSGNIKLLSGSGIDFSATAGTGTSELFDDYEEGTWTPVVTSGSIAGTGITYSGRYTKIGDTVTVYFQAATTGAVNDLVVASYVGLSGLPFAVASNLTSSGYSTTEDIDRSLGGEANVNGSILYLGACGSGSFTSKISATITYFTS